MTDRELMQMALDVIKDHTDMNNPQQQAFRNNAIKLLRDRLAQPEHTPEVLEAMKKVRDQHEEMKKQIIKEGING